ncbi:glycosyltransferase [Nocardia terpenica]|uniref:4,4'-diaponeurosporenoate glycosyltransferase n=1 Tax=Nocardia terpenica TaxID=455432 RepID=A0A6G9YZ52_9NOCA|nr:glycosyltransferase [Nocardia terpenica]QIS18450.1 glycosyltransferase [Nocardia terpenica]
MTAGSGISVVIICRDEEAYIDDCLRSVAAAAARSSPTEVIVVDGGSTDRTVELASAWADRPDCPMTVDVLRCEKSGYSVQRNAGVARARHPWVAFISADVRVGSEWLTGLRTMLSEPVSVVLGRFDLVAPQDRTPWLACVGASIYRSRTTDSIVERCSTVHLVARREMLLGNPFDEQLGACEDKDLAFRLKNEPAWGGAAYSPDRPVHIARESMGRFLVKLGREAHALGKLRRRYGAAFPDCFGWRHTTLGTLVGVLFAATAVVRGISGSTRSSIVTAVLAVVAFGSAGRRHVEHGSACEIPFGMRTALHGAATITLSVGWLAGWLTGDVASARE